MVLIVINDADSNVYKIWYKSLFLQARDKIVCLIWITWLLQARDKIVHAMDHMAFAQHEEFNKYWLRSVQFQVVVRLYDEWLQFMTH